VPPVVTFLSDYGLRDEFVGVCHGVILRRCPDARIIDITHGIDRHDVRAGALSLAAAVPFAPPGVHLAVVDPGVGGDRRAVALRAGDDDRLLVGPDNGLLSLAAQRLGGVVEAVDIGHSPHRLEPVSATFHGRDLFAPVAGALAAGEPLGVLGEPIAANSLTPLDLPQAHVEEWGLVAHVLGCDRFGNALLDCTHEQLSDAGLQLGGSVEVVAAGRPWRARYARTFAEVEPGELLVYEDSLRMLALAVNRGSAVDRLALERDQEIQVHRHE
jgi:S-adenosyl-L-methionine hydrolase (adenosine-forming)